MKAFDPSILGNFTGSQEWFRHGLARNVVYTEGAKYVAETAGAYWLLDEIALTQTLPELKREEFQVWKLRVNKNGTAELKVDDGNGNIVYQKKIEYTDFPIEGIDLWFQNNTIFLPSEY